MIPIGYTQSAGSNPLTPNASPLSLSVIGWPTPAAEYSNIRAKASAMFPDKNFGPLRPGR